VLFRCKAAQLQPVGLPHIKQKSGYLQSLLLKLRQLVKVFFRISPEFFFASRAAEVNSLSFVDRANIPANGTGRYRSGFLLNGSSRLLLRRSGLLEEFHLDNPFVWINLALDGDLLVVMTFNQGLALFGLEVMQDPSFHLHQLIAVGVDRFVHFQSVFVAEQTALAVGTFFLLQHTAKANIHAIDGSHNHVGLFRLRFCSLLLTEPNRTDNSQYHRNRRNQ
jgi:hypothetical protein